MPNTTTWIVVGLEVSDGVLEGQGAAQRGDAGLFGSANLPAAGPGPVTVELTVPNAPGTCAIYARLLAQPTAEAATGLFVTGYPGARERHYVKVGTMTVP